VQDSSINWIHDKPFEKCAVFGVYTPGLEASRLTYFGLFALQHRGQESSGICSSNGSIIRTIKGNGLVAQVYADSDLEYLHGHMAIGHNRYSTSGGSLIEHNQPVIGNDNLFALAHNGNLPSTAKLEEFLKKKGISHNHLNDSGMMAQAIKYYFVKGNSLEDSVKKAYPLFTGAFSLLVMDKEKIIAVRDSFGIRPLSLGSMGNGFIISSETCALDTIGAVYQRDVKPGEMIVMDKDGIRFEQIEDGVEKLDLFELVYFARPDSMLAGKRVNQIREEFGRSLARYHGIEADVVVPVPDSGIPAALGYSKESGIPIDFGLNKNRYIHRTFIRPAQNLRDRDVALKLIPIPEVLNGKRVILIDDSIVRGTTIPKIVKLIRGAGAKEVHVRISSSPVKYPDFYGIDMPNQKELIAASRTINEIREFSGADSLEYLTYKEMIDATGLPEDRFCTACFTGKYPIDIGEHNTKNIDFTK
jgi:amidophosphoribosyltransferase